MNPVLDRDTALRTGASAAVLELVERRQLPVPQQASDAAEVLATLDNLEAEADPTAPELPTNPAQVGQILKEAAERRVNAAAVRSLASELRPRAVDRLNAAVLDAGATWVAALCRDFDKAVTTLRSAAAAAPKLGSEGVAQLTASQFKGWSAATATVLELEALVKDREILTRLLQEPRRSHWGSVLPLIAAVAPPTGDGQAVHVGFQSRIEIKQTLALADPMGRWSALLALEERGWLKLSLCPANAVSLRIGLIDAWPRAFERLSYRDHGQAFATALADSGRSWEAVNAR